MGVKNFMSGDGVVTISVLEGGRADSSAVSVCWHQEALWRHGWDVSIHKLVESCQPLLLPVRKCSGGRFSSWSMCPTHPVSLDL